MIPVFHSQCPFLMRTVCRDFSGPTTSASAFPHPGKPLPISQFEVTCLKSDEFKVVNGDHSTPKHQEDDSDHPTTAHTPRGA